MSDLRLDLPKKFKQMRAVKGLTLEQAGKAIGKNSNTISNYECGKMSPRFETIEDLCEAYGYKIMIVPKGTKVVR